jgi:hypothetical protein
MYKQGLELMTRLRASGRLKNQLFADQVFSLLELRAASLGDDPEAAVAAADRFLAINPDNWLGRFHAASGYAAAASILRHGRPVTALSTEELARDERYVGRSLELLQQAVSKGLHAAGSIRHFPALDPLRDRPEYAKLLADMKPPPPSK